MLDPSLTAGPITVEVVLKREITRLNKIITALMDRAERSTSVEACDFSLFQTAIILEEQVRSRTEELQRRQERLDVVLEASNTGLWQWDPVSHTVEFSPSYYTLLGYAPGEFSADQETWPTLVHPDDWPATCQILYDATHASDDAPFSAELRMRAKMGDWRWVQWRGRVTERDDKGCVRCVVGVNSDISERKRSESLDRLRSNILEELARGQALPALLNALALGIEAEQTGYMVSILLVDDQGCLHKGAAPSLPEFYSAALEGLAIGDGVGSCGTAAFRGERVIVTDIRQHPYWEDYRDLAARAGVAACWSQPVFDQHGLVVAVFAIYSPKPTTPGERDLVNLVHAANLASIAIGHHRDEKRLQMAMQALETTSESVYWLDVYGHILYVNPATVQELGYSADELCQMTISDIDPNTPSELWGPDGALMRTMKTSGLHKMETLHKHRDGHLIPVEVDSDAFHFDGQTLFIAISRDISKRQLAEQALRKSEARFAALFSLTPDPMALTRLADGVVLEVSRSYVEYFGYQREEVIGHCTLAGDLDLWVDADQRRQWKERVDRDGEALSFEAPMRKKDGSIATVLISGKLVEMDGERCAIVDIHDITERKLHAEHLEQIAHHDPLTGLPNRLLLEDRLRQAIAQNQRSTTCLAVCYLDLDGFKQINDRFGHQAGDQVLIEVANRLTAAVRGGDTVARLGGDEFVILLSHLGNDDECRLALDRLLQTVSAPYMVGQCKQSGISASIGVALFAGDQGDADTLMRNADHAMYAAKQGGKNRYQMFDRLLA